MSRELPNRRICKIVIAGPKNYAYLHCDMNGGDVQLTRKIRGFEMTHAASKKLTFNAIFDQVKLQFGFKKEKPRLFY